MTKNDICYMAIDGRDNEENAVERLCEIGDKAKDKFGFGEIVVLSAREPRNPPKHTKVVKIQTLDYKQYSQFVFSQLHAYTDKPFILIYQDDGFAVHPENWDDAFLAYDYIGAPWPHLPWFPWAVEGFDVGNGGFSLRSKKLCEACSTLPFPYGQAEDMVICVHYRNLLTSKGFKFAPLEVAKKFSYEHKVDPLHTFSSSFGFHAKFNLNLVPKND